MKKIYLFGLALAAGLMLASCQKENEPEVKINVASFEEVALGESQTNAPTVDGYTAWTSGEFTFHTAVTYSGSYVYDFVASGQQENTYASYTDQYHSAKGGAAKGNNFVVAFQDSWSENNELGITWTEAKVIPGCYLSNNAYAVNSMENGDAYAKKFTAEDWFKLTITGYNGANTTGTVDFYLAKDGNIVKTWEYCDLSSLGEINKVVFALTSSDSGDYGMNTPAYFCLDEFGAKK